MDVYFGNYGNCDDACDCVCGSRTMADQRIFSMFTARLNVGESFCVAFGFESTVDVVLFLDMEWVYLYLYHSDAFRT